VLSTPAACGPPWPGQAAQDHALLRQGAATALPCAIGTPLAARLSARHSLGDYKCTPACHTSGGGCSNAACGGPGRRGPRLGGFQSLGRTLDARCCQQRCQWGNRTGLEMWGTTNNITGPPRKPGGNAAVPPAAAPPCVEATSCLVVCDALLCRHLASLQEATCIPGKHG